MEPTRESLSDLIKQFHTTQSDLQRYNGEYILLDGELTDNERDPEVGRMWHARFTSDNFEVDVFEDELSDVDSRMIQEIAFRCGDGLMDNEHILACLDYINLYGIDQFINEIDDNSIWRYYPYDPVGAIYDYEVCREERDENGDIIDVTELDRCATFAKAMKLQRKRQKEYPDDDIIIREYRETAHSERHLIMVYDDLVGTINNKVAKA